VSKRKARVEVDCNNDMTGGGLYIYGGNGKEIMSWTEDEWKDDSTVPVAMANAVKIFYEKGEEALRKLCGRPKNIG